MKAILLVRVSSTHQDLVQQTEKVKAEAIKDGYSENDLIVLEDKESAVKLSEEERNGLNRLKYHVENDDIACVYTYEVSRISRQPAMLYNIRDFLMDHHVQLIILNPYMKMLNDDFTLSASANIFFGIFASMSENEGFLRKQRCQRGIDKRRASGKYFGGRIPLGYDYVDDKLVINERDARLVRRVFNDYIDGVSVRDIGKMLQDEGFRPHLDLNTMRQNVFNILTREYYCGDNLHPAIITKELYDNAREKAKSKTVYKLGLPCEAIFKGKMFDDNGYTMRVNNRQRFYFCDGTTLSFKVTDTILWGIVVEWYNNIYVIKKNEYTNKLIERKEQQQNIVRTMTMHITDNQDKIDRIEERYIYGKISKERADELERKVFDQLNEYKRKLNDTNAELTRIDEMLRNDTVIRISSHMTLNDMIEVVNNVVDRITVKKLAFYIANVTIRNKITGEIRIIEVNTRKCEIVNIKILKRPTLSAPE